MYYIVVIIRQFWTIILMFQSNYIYSVIAGRDLIHDTRHLTSKRIRASKGGGYCEEGLLPKFTGLTT